MSDVPPQQHPLPRDNLNQPLTRAQVQERIANEIPIMDQMNDDDETRVAGENMKINLEHLFNHFLDLLVSIIESQITKWVKNDMFLGLEDNITAYVQDVKDTNGFLRSVHDLIVIQILEAFCEIEIYRILCSTFIPAAGLKKMIKKMFHIIDPIIHEILQMFSTTVSNFVFHHFERFRFCTDVLVDNDDKLVNVIILILNEASNNFSQKFYLDKTIQEIHKYGDWFNAFEDAFDAEYRAQLQREEQNESEPE